jgi:thiamine-phosphate pyrophosphorylase
LREKNFATLEFIEQALSIKAHLKAVGIPLIINDRLDVAQAVRADGVHLGQTDIPLKIAREIVQKKMIIGISVETHEDVLRAEEEGADYIGAGPLFATTTKTDTSPVIGPDGLHKIKEITKIPVVAIGGISQYNCKEVIRHGADGIAVVSAIVSADDPEQAASKLRNNIETERRCR